MAAVGLAELEQRSLCVLVANGIHSGTTSENAAGQSLLAIVGVTAEGKKQRAVIADRFRESTASWLKVLLAYC
jgi:transposase-like protein